MPINVNQPRRVTNAVTTRTPTNTWTPTPAAPTPGAPAPGRTGKALSLADVHRILTSTPAVRDKWTQVQGVLDGLPDDEKSKKQKDQLQAKLDKIIGSDSADEASKLKAMDTVLRPSQPSGWKQKALHSAMDVLKVLDTPRAVAASAIKEGQDALGSGNASWDEFKHNVSTHASGRELFLQDGTWLGDNSRHKSFSGFGIDILTDPLSWMTGGLEGAGKGGAEAVGRKLLEKEVVDQLAERAATKLGVEVGSEAAQKAGRTEAEALAAKVVQKGKSSLTDSERQLIGARGGLMFGAGEAKVHIPGSQRLTEPLGQALHAIPEGLRGSKTYTRLAEAFGGELAPKYRSAILGLEGQTAKETADNLILKATERSAKYSARGLERKSLGEIGGALKALSPDDNEHLLRFLDEGAKDVPRHIDELGTKTRSILDDMLRRENVARVANGYEPIPRLEDWLRHSLTDDTAKVLEGETDSALKRTLRAGDNFRGRTLETGGIREINRIAREDGLKDVFKSDVKEVIPEAIRKSSQRVAVFERLAKLQESGLLKEGLSTQGLDLQAQADEVAKKVGDLETKITKGRTAVEGTRDRLAASQAIAEARRAEQLSNAAEAQGTLVADAKRLGAQYEGRAETAGLNLADVRDTKGAVANEASDQLLGETAAYGPLDQLSERLSSLQGNAAEMTPNNKLFDRTVRRADRINQSLDFLLSMDGHTLSKTLGDLATTPDDLADHFNAMRSVLGRGPETAREDATMVSRLRELGARENKLSNEVRTRLEAAANKYEEAERLATLDPAQVLPVTPTKELEQNLALHAQAARQEADLTLMGDSLRQQQSAWNKLRTNPRVQRNMSAQITDAMHEMGKDALRLEGSDYLFGNEWVVDALKRMEKVRSPEGTGQLLKYYDGLTNWWKAFAVTSPGFVFRNGFGAALNNFVHDVPLVEHLNWMRAAQGGGSAETRRLYERIVEAGLVDTGQVAEEVASHTSQNAAWRKVSKVMPLSQNNALTVGIRNVNTKLENTVRGAMAMHVLREGGTIEDAIELVTKVHFDYADLSKFDRAAKRVIPFWTFTKNNLPLQIELMARRPGVYDKYYQAANNTGLTNEQFLPQYFNELGAIRVTGGKPGSSKYLTPDLPFISAIEQLQKIGNVAAEPARLGEELNPIVKTPLERWAGKQFFSDIPIDDPTLKPVPSAWTKDHLLIGGLGLIGVAHKGDDGQWMMNDKNLYTVEQYLPLLGRLRRQFPSEDRYKERKTSSWLSFAFGIGLRTNTNSQIRSELFRRGDDLRQLEKDLIAKGVLPDPNAPKSPPSQLTGL
jgi:hypothetical protein